MFVKTIFCSFITLSLCLERASFSYKLLIITIVCENLTSVDLFKSLEKQNNSLCVMNHQLFALRLEGLHPQNRLKQGLKLRSEKFFRQILMDIFIIFYSSYKTYKIISHKGIVYLNEECYYIGDLCVLLGTLREPPKTQLFQISLIQHFLYL